MRPEVNDEEPDLAAREARSLCFVEQLEVATPRLLAVDPTGDDAGVPALLMTYLPGRLDWSPSDMERWLHSLADLLPRIHSAELPAPRAIPAFAPDTPSNWEPPPWARRPRIWERAIEIYHRQPPDLAAVFLHGDFHPGNVLWRRGVVSGIVDWQGACVGPSSRDVAHCRANLFAFGLDVADRFTRIWERLTSECFHPWAELIGIIGDLHSLREEPPHRDDVITEEVLGRALAQLG
ncbi:MAG: phosphotransferase family protein [Acidimicrobiales bacterium]